MVPTTSSYAESLKCTVCLEMCRDPLTLPTCGHSVCSACVQQLIANTTAPASVVCPECRTRSPVTTNGFPRNYRLADMIATLEAAGYRETSQCSDCRSQVPNRRLRECDTCVTEGSLLLCADCALHRHKDHVLVEFRDPPAPAQSNPSAQAVVPNPGTNGERTPQLSEDCCGRFKAAILDAITFIFVFLVMALAWFVMVLLCHIMGPLNVLALLAFGLVIYGNT